MSNWLRPVRRRARACASAASKRRAASKKLARVFALTRRTPASHTQTAALRAPHPQTRTHTPPPDTSTIMDAQLSALVTKKPLSPSFRPPDPFLLPPLQNPYQLPFTPSSPVPMASARTLSTVELGADQYRSATSSSKWPVQIRLPLSNADNQHTKYTVLVDEAQRYSLTRTARNDWRVTFSTPQHVLRYKLYRDATLVSTGGLHVRAPEPPLSTQHPNSVLSSTQPAGAVVLPLPPKAGLRPVQFVFRQHAWFARQVFVRSDHFESPGLSLQKTQGAFQATAYLPLGTVQYRFVVVPMESVPLHSAPFTNFGWDQSAAQSDQQFVTWPMLLAVEDGTRVKEEQLEYQVCHADVPPQQQKQLDSTVSLQSSKHHGRRPGLRSFLMTVAICITSISVAAFVMGQSHSLSSESDYTLQPVQSSRNHDDDDDNDSDLVNESISDDAMQHILGSPS